MALQQEGIGTFVKRAREEAGLTQQDLADKIGLRQGQSISRYERGETEIPPKRLRRIAEVTGKPLSFFVAEPEPHNGHVEEGSRWLELRTELRREFRMVNAKLDRLAEQQRASSARSPR